MSDLRAEELLEDEPELDALLDDVDADDLLDDELDLDLSDEAQADDLWSAHDLA